METQAPIAAVVNADKPLEDGDSICKATSSQLGEAAEQLAVPSEVVETSSSRIMQMVHYMLGFMVPGGGMFSAVSRKISDFN